MLNSCLPISVHKDIKSTGFEDRHTGLKSDLGTQLAL